MFDVDTFVDRCIAAGTESTPQLAVRELLTEVLADTKALRETFAPSGAGLMMLHQSDDLTVMNIVWAPHMRLYPHDHRMWAAIGTYTGREDNEFFRRDGDRLIGSGGKTLRERDVTLLGDDTIHAVRNPLGEYTGAIHVYGGDFVNQPRSQWDPETLVEQPFDLDQARAQFAAADAEYRDR